MNDDEVYEVDNCQPAIPTSTLMRMTDGLNQTDDLSAFVRGMSKLPLACRNAKRKWESGLTQLFDLFQEMPSRISYECHAKWLT